MWHLSRRCCAVLAGLCLLGGGPGLAWAGKVCHEEHGHVSLIGHVRYQTFAGPPNYDSVRRGDARERMPVLRLAKPLCVRVPEADGRRLKNRDINTLQLLGAEGRVPSSAKRVYRVTGHLVLAESGHHHVPVLLEVEHIDLAKRP